MDCFADWCVPRVQLEDLLADSSFVKEFCESLGYILPSDLAMDFCGAERNVSSAGLIEEDSWAEYDPIQSALSECNFSRLLYGDVVIEAVS